MVKPIILKEDPVPSEMLEEIKVLVNKAIEALKGNNLETTLEACTALGLYFQKNFLQRPPIGKTRDADNNEIFILDQTRTETAGLDNICKALKNLNDFDRFEESELHSLNIMAALMQARFPVQQTLTSDVVNADTEKVSAKLNAIKLGTEMFCFLARPKDAKLPDISEAEINAAEMIIYEKLPQTEAVIQAKDNAVVTALSAIEAQDVLTIIEKDSNEAKIHLSKILSKEASKLPNRGSEYHPIDANKIILTDQYDITKFANDIVKREGYYKENAPNDKLKNIAERYSDMKTLHAAASAKGKPQNILKKVKKEFTAIMQKNQEADTNSKVPRILIKFGHLLASVFSKDKKIAKNISEKLENTEARNSPKSSL